MRLDELGDDLLRTLDDHRLTRSEKQALQAALAAKEPTAEDLAVLRARVFAAASARAGDAATRDLLAWCEDVTKLLLPPAPQRQVAEAWFGPGPGCVNRVIQLIDGARHTIDVCVFTITDDRIARVLLEAHARRVRVRVLTDDEKAGDLGSDIPRLSQAGIPVAIDRSPKHMHHKFALFDRRLVLTGSYNWTRAAADENEENFVVSGEPRLLQAFAGEFERLWLALAPR
ncbi:MAG: phospholipase D-like domain-containing protein [Planctomycetota bacterium]